MKRVLFTLFVLTIFVLLLSCSPKIAPAEKSSPKTETPAAQTASKAAWELEWEKTVVAAKKEGKVSVISAGNMVAARDPFARIFKEKFGIDVDFVSGSGAQVAAKLINERKAGLYLVDVYIGGATTIATMLLPNGALDPLEPFLILPETTDPKLWWGGQPMWIDKAKTSLGFFAYSSTPITLNANLAKESQVKTYQDLLNPQWKGKIIIDDITRPGPGLKWFGVMGSKVLGFDYMRQLVKQEPVVMRDSRLAVEWLAQGKGAIGIALYDAIIKEFQDSGASHLIKVSLAEGSYMTVDGGVAGVVNKAPHPNAARLLINWLLTKEGQTISSQVANVASARLDVPTQHLDPLYLLKPGVNYIRSDELELLLGQTEQAQLARDIFGKLVQ